jgi:hypothetical protein
VRTLDRVLCRVRGKLRDRREFWSSPERDVVAWEDLTGGEKSRRQKFFRLIGGGVAGAVAIREVLDLGLGPELGFQTQEEFEAFWCPDKCGEIADRWKNSPHFRGFATDRTGIAQTDLRARAPDFAAVLWDVANDPQATPTAKVKACQVALNLAGLVSGMQPREDVGNVRELLRKKTRALMEKRSEEPKSEPEKEKVA